MIGVLLQLLVVDKKKRVSFGSLLHLLAGGQEPVADRETFVVVWQLAGPAGVSGIVAGAVALVTLSSVAAVSSYAAVQS